MQLGRKHVSITGTARAVWVECRRKVRGAVCRVAEQGTSRTERPLPATHATKAAMRFHDAQMHRSQQEHCASDTAVNSTARFDKFRQFIFPHE